jgi:glycosyltransferase involved in cell wall biosynthesis
MPKVSVIIPVYNTEKYLNRCLNSVCNQTLKDIEIICVNDCSTDNSLYVLREYAVRDNRIKIVDFKYNQGVSIARNAALDIAKGEFLAFLDPDDWIDLNFYESLYLKYLETGADIIKCDLKEILPDGVEKIYPLNKHIKETNDKLYFVYAFTSAIYKNKNIKFIENMPFGEDILYLNENVIIANCVSVVDDVYYYYHRRDGSATGGLLSYEKVNAAYITYKQVLKNINLYATESTSIRGYLFILFWLIGASIGVFRSSDSDKSRKKALDLIFYLLTNFRDNDYICSEVIKKYFALLYFAKNYDFSKAKDFILKNDSSKKMMIANLRFNTTLKRGDKNA